MDRSKIIEKIKSAEIADVFVIGGGASGLGVALDAVSRSLKVVLTEKHDFGKGTTSKATKLLHGGVRYLAQGDIGLVMEAFEGKKNHTFQCTTFIQYPGIYHPFLQYLAGLFLSHWT